MEKQHNANSFFTNFGYLSINKNYLDTTEAETIEVEGVYFNVYALKNNITYIDNRYYYRWKRADYNRCRV